MGVCFRLIAAAQHAVVERLPGSRADSEKNHWAFFCAARTYTTTVVTRGQRHLEGAWSLSPQHHGRPSWNPSQPLFIASPGKRERSLVSRSRSSLILVSCFLTLGRLHRFHADRLCKQHEQCRRLLSALGLTARAVRCRASGCRNARAAYFASPR